MVRSDVEVSVFNKFRHSQPAASPAVPFQPSFFSETPAPLNANSADGGSLSLEGLGTIREDSPSSGNGGGVMPQDSYAPVIPRRPRNITDEGSGA